MRPKEPLNLRLRDLSSTTLEDKWARASMILLIVFVAMLFTPWIKVTLIVLYIQLKASSISSHLQMRRLTSNDEVDLE